MDESRSLWAVGGEGGNDISDDDLAPGTVVTVAGSNSADEESSSSELHFRRLLDWGC